jgi:hypothetical protein
MKTIEHATEIGEAIRRLRRAMLHAGFEPDDFGLAITRKTALEQLRMIATSELTFARYDVRAPAFSQWEGMQLITTYGERP